VNLAEKAVALSAALRDAGIPHAFGGAVALIYCTSEVRATIDLDVNVFVDHRDARRGLLALPDDVEWTQQDEATIVADGQARLWWGDTPVDVFFDTTDFHRQVARRAVTQPFLGTDLPVLSCSDLAVFKAFFDRTKDWADLEAMATAGALDVAAVCGALVAHLGADDPRIARVRSLVSG
jgi:hypothetical protein